MILVYNEQGLNDTLLCIFHKENENIEKTTEQTADYTVIKQADKIIGVNIKDASKKFTSLAAGVELGAKYPEEITTYLNGIGVESGTATLKQAFVVGYVKERVDHPDSNKLSVCQVDVGDKTLQIVCGAANVDAGQKVIVAQVGCMMPIGLVIEPSVLRKVDSNGMICSGRELNLPADYQTPGILVLENDAPVGANFFEYFDNGMKVQ